MNLGEKLKAANEARAQAISLAETRMREQEAAKFAKDNATITDRLKEIAADLEADILSDKTPSKIRLARNEPWNGYNWPSKTIKGVNEARTAFASHAHATALVSFFQWAEDNGLVGVFKYDWDGGGMESWHCATVEAPNA